MKAKYINNNLYIFEKSSSMTGVFSGIELNELFRYIESNIETEFIQRLYDLRILVKGSDLTPILNLKKENTNRLKYIHIDITDYCPLDCKQCYKKQINNDYMDYDIFKKLIDEADKMNIFQIALGGGEAMSHPHIYDFVSYVARTQMAISITTSGYYFTNSVLQKLINSGINHIQVSLNSYIESVNNLSRDGYNYAINCLKKLQYTNLSHGINIVVRKDNLYTIEETVDFAKSVGCENVNFLRYKKSKHEIYDENYLDKKDMIYLSSVIKSISGITVKVDSAFSNLLIYMNNGYVDKDLIGCGAGKDFITITPQGNFMPCSHLTYEKALSISDYLNNSNYLKVIKNSKFSKNSDCNTCSYNKYCKGCVAICIDENLIGERDCVGYKEKENV